jgi:hypothetical protein
MFVCHFPRRQKKLIKCLFEAAVAAELGVFLGDACVSQWWDRVTWA